MIYHLLSEVEPFSEYHGGALSRWAANVLRGDELSTIVCPWADVTWGFPEHRVWSLAGLRNYATWSKILRPRSAIPLRLALLRTVFEPLFAKLKRGDTVYIHNRPEVALALRSMCRRKGAHIVLHLQNSHLLTVPLRYQALLDVDAMVFCSSFLKREALGYSERANTAVVIPNGADEKCFFPAKTIPKGGPPKPVCLFVGRLVPEKGIHIFVEALRLLLEKDVSVTGRIIGSTGFGHNRASPYVGRIKTNLPTNVEFAEYLSGDRLAEEFRQATIFCCPSVFNEPFGMVNVEAMATRIPVVASAVGGIPEIFQQGGGILVRPGSATALANALESLLENPEKREELAEQGYKSYKSQFRWQEIRRQYLDVVRQWMPMAA
ncbi:MAG: glycosyltransferase family 4 protein [Candidatus Acidiferrum sp.]